MRQDILTLMKKQIGHIGNTVSFENYKEMEGQLHRVFSILESAETMLDTDTSHVLESNTEEQTLPPLLAKILSMPDIATEETMQELLDESLEDKDIEIENKVYRFERRIKGGVVPEIEAFVPEKIIHDLDLSHGDLVRAKFLFKPDNGPRRYEYELVEKSSLPSSPENIIEIHMAVVSYEPRHGGLSIAKTVSSDEILYEGRPLVLCITDEDLAAMDLSEGDIVNAAFYANNPDFMRIRWRYSMDEYQSEQTPKKNPSFYKQKEESTKDLEQIFEGKVICAMGYEPGHSAYRDEVESRGGTFVGVTGKEGEISLASSIRKVDTVVMVLNHVGHTGTKWAVPFCKENNIPYTSIKTFGRSTFVDAAANLLGK